MVDSSVALAILLKEVHTESATSFFQELTDVDRLLAPPLMLVECTSRLRQAVVAGDLNPDEAATKLDGALRLPLEIVHRLDQHPEALRIAAATRASRAYDVHYLAVASLESAELVTIDGGMYQNATNLSIPARLLR